MIFYTVLNMDERGNAQPSINDAGVPTEMRSFTSVGAARDWNRDHNSNRGKILETYVGRSASAGNDCEYWKHPIEISGDGPETRWVSTFGEKAGWPTASKSAG